jgi:hypothetical protein
MSAEAILLRHSYSLRIGTTTTTTKPVVPTTTSVWVDCESKFKPLYIAFDEANQVL